MNTEDILDLLNNVLGYIYDSHNGYKECADVVADETMKNLFKLLANQRANMINELKAEITARGGKPVEGGSAIGSVHRLFVDLKSLVTGGGTDAIVNEIKRGENTLISSYKDALRQELPADIHGRLSHQLEAIEHNLTQIDQLSIAAGAE